MTQMPAAKSSPRSNVHALRPLAARSRSVPSTRSLTALLPAGGDRVERSIEGLALTAQRDGFAALVIVRGAAPPTATQRWAPRRAPAVRSPRERAPVVSPPRGFTSQ